MGSHAEEREKIWEIVREREAERDSCKAELKQCQIDHTSCEQQTTKLQEEIDELQAELVAAEQTLQEIEGGTPSKDQQVQGSSYLHAEENSLGMLGDHQENQGQEAEFVKA